MTGKKKWQMEEILWILDMKRMDCSPEYILAEFQLRFPERPVSLNGIRYVWDKYKEAPEYNQEFSAGEVAFILGRSHACDTKNGILRLFERDFPYHDWPEHVERASGIEFVIAKYKNTPQYSEEWSESEINFILSSRAAWNADETILQEFRAQWPERAMCEGRIIYVYSRFGIASMSHIQPQIGIQSNPNNLSRCQHRCAPSRTVPARRQAIQSPLMPQCRIMKRGRPRKIPAMDINNPHKPYTVRSRNQLNALTGYPETYLERGTLWPSCVKPNSRGVLAAQSSSFANQTSYENPSTSFSAQPQHQEPSQAMGTLDFHQQPAMSPNPSTSGSLESPSGEQQLAPTSPIMAPSPFDHESPQSPSLSDISSSRVFNEIDP